MSKKNKPVVEQELASLEEKVESLVAVVEQLMKENRSLRAQQENLTMERAGLLEKGEPLLPCFCPVGDARDERPHRSIHTFRDGLGRDLAVHQSHS